MIINPRDLRQNLLATLSRVDMQIEEVERMAKDLGCRPEALRDANGAHMLAPLLVAKVQGLAALAQLNEKK